MKWIEVIERIEKLPKDEVVIKEYYYNGGQKNSVTVNDRRYFDVTNPQLKKLKNLGYVVERIVI